MVDTVPCLTRCRGASSYGGHCLLKRQRVMKDIEIARLQRIPDNHYQKAAMALGLRKYRAAIGNAMSANVLARVLAYALPAASLDCRDNAAPTAEFMEHILESRRRPGVLVGPRRGAAHDSDADDDEPSPATPSSP